MRPEIFLPLAFLFLACGVPSNAQEGPSAEKTVSVRVGAPLTVECSVRVEQRVEWRLDGGAVPAELVGAGEAPAPGGRLTARLHAAAARPHHAGLYTCSTSSPAQRIRVLVSGAPTAAPAVPAVPAVPAGEGETTTAEAAVERAAGAAAGAADGQEVLYDVGRLFSLNCTPPGVVDKSAISYVWKKNGTALESVWELADRYELAEEHAVFRMTKRSVEDDFGNYTCEPSGAATATFVVRGRPHAKLPSDTNVVEDTKLKIVCKVVGKPHPGVTWTFSNDSASNGSEVRAALGERVTLGANEHGVADAELVLEAARRSDAGVYTCSPRDATATAATAASTTLRVKDKYAALWPFLGICAEVFVLCAIILVYEKRRTKPELDDSDTDNHDQKKS